MEQTLRSYLLSTLAKGTGTFVGGAGNVVQTLIGSQAEGQTGAWKAPL